jgi:excisionase family DNA binding protein
MARPEVTGKGLADGEDLTFSIPEAGRRVGLGRNASYAAAKRGELPVVWFGRLGRVPKAALAKRLEQAGQRARETAET